MIVSKNDIIDELHKPARRNYPRRSTITLGIDDLWQADLVEMDSDASHSRTEGLSQGVDLNSQHKPPKNLQTDNGKEFYNKDFKKLMEQNKINHYSTYSDKKAAIVERFNRSLKELMWKQFSIQGNYKWVDILPNLLNIYNNRKHRTIGMTPCEASQRLSLKDVSERHLKMCPKGARKAPERLSPRDTKSEGRLVQGTRFKVGDYLILVVEKNPVQNIPFCILLTLYLGLAA
ncbi:uncharacterized protein [Polyergus mexicanus]|uniref:uncharacterized protein n=1 Tax=Polyergus mexicanus TaxID=615972 RepID=UPI0038B56CDE